MAARELMLEVGPEALSLRQVARRADFSPAALYTYFSSREELVAALFAESFQRLDEYLRRVPDDLPLQRRVVELGMAYMDFARDNPMDLRCVLLATSQEGLPSSSGSAVGLGAARLIAETFRKVMEHGNPGGRPSAVARRARLELLGARSRDGLHQRHRSHRGGR